LRTSPDGSMTSGPARDADVDIMVDLPSDAPFGPTDFGLDTPVPGQSIDAAALDTTIDGTRIAPVTTDGGSATDFGPDIPVPAQSIDAATFDTTIDGTRTTPSATDGGSALDACVPLDCKSSI
jgi:hypothetical protein